MPPTRIESVVNNQAAMWSYYDWAITGANCMVYLSSTETKVTRQLKNVPVVAVSYQIEQSKAPLYGYNDIGPRKIVRGHRTVAGNLVIAHREVGYLQKILRNATYKYNTSERLDIKEELRLKYWNTRNWDDWDMKDPMRRKFTNEEDQYNVFFAHPNFDISIVYGTGDDIGKLAANENYLDLTNILKKTSQWQASTSTGGYQDVNPLYRPSNQIDLNKQRETIAGVQLTGMLKQVAADGEIIVEAYSFLAMDVIPK